MVFQFVDEEGRKTHPSPARSGFRGLPDPRSIEVDHLLDDGDRAILEPVVKRFVDAGQEGSSASECCAEVSRDVTVSSDAALVDISRKANAYLHAADRLLPGWITDFYVVGSAALGEYVPRRSDLDFVAVVDGRLSAGRMARLRLMHAVGAVQGIVHSGTGGTPNGVFVTGEDITKPVTAITPVASHTGHQFSVSKGFDVNPVVWKVLAEAGIRVRGRESANLGIDPQPERFKQWNLANLDAYWRPLGHRMARGDFKKTFSGFRYGYAWGVSWCVLGAPRLHYSIATGEVIGKKTAGEYARDTFGPDWHAIVDLGLRWWHRNLSEPVCADDARRAGEFVETVAASAHLLPRQ